MRDTPKTTALAPWFGCARMVAAEVGQLLSGCRWVGIPFAGAMPELLHITANTIVVSDVHRHVINLAMCLADERIGPKMYRHLRRMPLSEEVLDDAQQWLKIEEPPGRMPDYDAAVRYFTAVWMGRSGKSGTNDEFNGGVSVRWNCSGGDSAVRYHSAVKSIVGWRRILRRCTIVCQDCFEFLDNVQDADDHAVYCDPPFPGPGAKYKHTFSDQDHVRLTERLSEFTRARVVCRFYDHPLIRELYPQDHWTWRRLAGRDQTNQTKPEVLLLNGPSYVAAGRDGRLF